VSTEVELKIPVADLGRVRTRLEAADGEQIHGALREVNVLLDTANQELTAAGFLLRLRRIGNRHLLTLKGPPVYTGPIKEREEHELVVEDAGVMATVLERLGYRPVVHYEKDRETWRLGSVIVTLDHTPMGDFVEIEGPRHDLHAVAAAIGLDPAAAVRGSYVSLWHEYRHRHPEQDLPLDMVF
jgi:adenylate cyclase class 2